MRNELTNKRILVIGGAGFIGGFVVSELLTHDLKEVVIYDNFARGKMENIEVSLKDDRCSIFPLGGIVMNAVTSKNSYGSYYYYYQYYHYYGDGKS